MENAKVLWSGITGETGLAALKVVREIPGVEIVAGMTRHNSDGKLENNGQTFEWVEWLNYDSAMFGLHGLVRRAKRADVNVIADFSHVVTFEKVVELAVRLKVPLVSGTLGLSSRQMALLYNATERIPVFRSQTILPMYWTARWTQCYYTHAGTPPTSNGLYSGKHRRRSVQKGFGS